MDLTDKLVPLSRNVFWVVAPGKGRFPFSNGFLITGNENILIDAGMGEERIREVDTLHHIDCLIISHSHLDHLLHWTYLKDRRILLPRETPDSFTDLMQMGIRYTGSPENAEVWKKRVAKDFGFIPLRQPDGRYTNGDIIDNGSVRIEPIHAPGHLNDHYCFFIHGDDVLLSTDIDFESFGPWYGNPESDVTRFKESIIRISHLPFKTVCSSHKPPLDQIEAPQAFERYLKIFDRHQNLVYDLCSNPVSLDDIISASPFYRNKMPHKILQRVYEGQMIRKNLEILIGEGQVEKSGSFYRQVAP